MRKIYLFFIAQLIISTLVQAQSPQRFSYQAVLRNASNALLSNQSIGMRISILQGSATGTASYVETHTATTSAQGLINLEIGGGTVVSGSLSGINWGAGAYFVKTETDPAGGTNYSLVSTTRLQSVPYAMHASTAGNGVANGTASNQIMYWNGSSWVALDPGVNGQVLTMCNGVLTWTNGGLCPGSIGTLNCGGATKNGTLAQGTAASGVTASVPYTQGNGGVHSGQTVTSTGVVGLTATLAAGTFATGAGNLSYAISGTPAGNGSANFALNIGGKTCTLTLSVQSLGVGQFPAGAVFCASGATAVVDVTSPLTGKVWMDRNLGATRVATSISDAASYGDLYQWGRRSDGHQCRNSATTPTISSVDQPAHGSFILTIGNDDWRNPQNDNLWQGVNGIKNPCPSGYRIPTEAEWEAERKTWGNFSNTTGAISSPLKLPAGGTRHSDSGNLVGAGDWVGNWSSTIDGNASRSTSYYAGGGGVVTHHRALGRAVRCIKN